MSDSKQIDNNLTNDYRKILKLMFMKNQEQFGPLPGGKQKILISYSYGDSRAVTFSGIGNSLQTAFENARNSALKSIKNKDGAPAWTCMDFVTREEKIAKAELTKK